MNTQQLCERCGYDEAEGGPEAVPDIWVDRYLALCPVCAAAGHYLQDKFVAD